VAALLIANIAVGILTRAAPQLNIFAVGFPLTLAAGFFALWLAVPFIGPAIERVLEQAILFGLRLVEQLIPVR
jgi:flagellar biosynthetic protein FliR